MYTIPLLLGCVKKFYNDFKGITDFRRIRTIKLLVRNIGIGEIGICKY